MIRKVSIGLAWTLGLALAVVGIWMLFIGPVAVFRIITNGTTTVADGAWAGQGKGGQYLYVVPERGIVVVRQGEATGGISWASAISQVVASVR